MNRIVARCRVQCTKCGWKSTRSIQNVGEMKDVLQRLPGSTTYSHWKCRGKVLISRVKGLRVLQ